MSKDEKIERVFVDGKFIGFLCNQDYMGWFVQLPGQVAFTAPRWGMTRDEAVAYLKEQAA